MSNNSKNLVAYLDKFRQHIERFPDTNNTSITNLNDDDQILPIKTDNDITMNTIIDRDIEIYVFPYGGVSHGMINIWTNTYEKKEKEIKKLTNKNNDNVIIDNPYPNIKTKFNVNTVTHIIVCPQVVEEKIRAKILEKTGLSLEGLQQKNIILVSFMWVCKWLETKSIVNCTPFILKYGNNNNDDNDDNDNNEHINKKQKIENNDDDNSSKNDSADTSASNVRDCKQDLIDALSDMSSNYLAMNERHRGLSYQAFSKRLKDFKGPINRISQIDNMKGIQVKSNMYKMVKSIIENGKSQMLESRNNNPLEISIKLLKSVWGIGTKTAEKLVRGSGITTIEQLRESVKNGTIRLEHGQLIGLDRFEDFNLRIPRVEVEEINGVVMEYAQKIVPGVQGFVCGSYRRGKVDCGDVDILFVPPMGDELMKSSFLKELVNNLSKDGYLTDHLSLPGDSRYNPSHFGKEKRFELQKKDALKSEYSSGDEDDVKQKKYEQNASGRQNSSYMGVFKLKKEGSYYRRIDFKSYPTQCFPFALLSFTGSGNFNRSLRFFVDKIGGHLSDNSLRFNVSRDPKTNEYIAKSGHLVTDIKTERDIFRALKLDFYEPHERNYFLKDVDSVKMKDWERRERLYSAADDDDIDGDDDDEDYVHDECDNNDKLT